MPSERRTRSRVALGDSGWPARGACAESGMVSARHARRSTLAWLAPAALRSRRPARSPHGPARPLLSTGTSAMVSRWSLGRMTTSPSSSCTSAASGSVRAGTPGRSSTVALFPACRIRPRFRYTARPPARPPSARCGAHAASAFLCEDVTATTNACGGRHSMRAVCGAARRASWLEREEGRARARERAGGRTLDAAAMVVVDAERVRVGAPCADGGGGVVGGADDHRARGRRRSVRRHHQPHGRRGRGRHEQRDGKMRIEVVDEDERGETRSERARKRARMDTAGLAGRAGEGRLEREGAESVPRTASQGPRAGTASRD